jgi:hypothetical protein
MNFVRLPQNGVRWQGAGGELAVWTAGSVLVARLSHYGHAEFFAPLEERANALFRVEKSIALFFDAAALERYDSSLRTDLTSYFRARMKQIRRLDVFTQSRIVSMGVSVASLALGGLVKSHTDAASFRAALEQDLAAHQITGFSTAALDA